MTPLHNKIILITGASSGIGEATARHLAALGAHVVLGARRTQRLEALVAEIRSSGGRASFRALDVTDPASMNAFIDFALEINGTIDTLINNAGVMPLSPFAAGKVLEWNRMIDVNIRGVLHGIAAALPVMKRQGHGHFVNLSSIGGHRVWQSCGVYSATKFAVRAISEGLRLEHDDIRVTIVSPGVVESELADTISDPQAREDMRAFRAIALSPDAIARAIGYVVSEPDDVDVNEIIVRPLATVD
ncbi:SDR family oxidoreductase [Sphingobium boeckii]|uniref:NADP-dependent 3-hydroxy acid dehydrogenase YdfG n=1 Tax=Sphingobium boeckii TaxID=1082345 RepID=A0A7W9AJF3_9SPHN|nr:SDR family oxidoreductase [Sphingobium boeckii]MBB5686566.1 NADP-dependent 3-hydroxy acid dehydrogenase YdfG [Sphingobium boeckii]